MMQPKPISDRDKEPSTSTSCVRGSPGRENVVNTMRSSTKTAQIQSQRSTSPQRQPGCEQRGAALRVTRKALCTLIAKVNVKTRTYARLCGLGDRGGVFGRSRFASNHMLHLTMQPGSKTIPGRRNVCQRLRAAALHVPQDEDKRSSMDLQYENTGSESPSKSSKAEANNRSLTMDLGPEAMCV